MRKALIIQGGWDGHQPGLVSDYFKEVLEKEGFEVNVSDTLDVLKDLEYLKELHLIVPVWTMGEITDQQVNNVSEAVAHGVGLVGCHGGMCDAFRESVLWQFITGGNWVSHPGGDNCSYTVEFKNSSSPLVEEMKEFTVKSEQYYLHVDPAVEVLATTRFPVANGYHAANGPVDMPVCWSKKWGYGKVYYNSLGHNADIVKMPEVTEMMKRGFMWAAKGKDDYLNNNYDIDIFNHN